MKTSAREDNGLGLYINTQNDIILLSLQKRLKFALFCNNMLSFYASLKQNNNNTEGRLKGLAE